MISIYIDVEESVDLVVYFFKQKTAYDMRISDCSSDVCSSDLRHTLLPEPRAPRCSPVPGASRADDRRRDRAERRYPEGAPEYVRPCRSERREDRAAR